MAIWLERLAIDRWRHNEARAHGVASDGEGDSARPVALICETTHGPRIEAVNAAAFENGARRGMMLADARTLFPRLKAIPADLSGDLAFLERLAIWARRWGPWSSVDTPDGLLVDITAVAHLFGGEQALLADAQARFARQGLAARIAVAPTAGAAWALAHFGPEGAILAPEAEPERHLAPLPVAALRLDEETLLVLRRLGLKKISDLYEIDRDSLKRRFRGHRSPHTSPLLRLDQLLGRIPEPLLPVLETEQAIVQRRLTEPIRYRPLLDRVMADLAGDMARELEARGEGARRLELGLWRVDGEVLLRSLELAAATREAAHFIRLFASRLDDIEAGFGIELVRLRAVWTQRMTLGQEDLEATAARHGASLSDCIDRLSVRLGADHVHRPLPRVSHLPERAQIWCPPLAREPAGQARPVFRARPLKLLDRPEAIAVLYAAPDGLPRQFRWRGEVHEVVRAEGPERIAPEWWRERASARARDYYRIEDKTGRRYWIYRHGIIGDGRGGAPEWFLQGLYA